MLLRPLFFYVLLFSCISGFAQKIEKTVIVKSDRFVKKMALDSDGNLELYTLYYLDGKSENGKVVSLNDQKNFNTYNAGPGEIYTEISPLFGKIMISSDLGITNESDFLLRPITAKESSTYLKIPKVSEALYPDDLSYKMGIQEFIDNNPILNKDLKSVQLIDASSDKKGLSLYNLNQKLSHDKDGVIKLIYDTEESKIADARLDGYLAREDSPYTTKNGGVLQVMSKKVKGDNYYYFRNLGFANINKEGELISFEKYEDSFLFKFVKSLPVLSSNGESKGVLYYCNSGQAGGSKALRNPVKNEFVVFYFDEFGKKVFQKKFIHGVNPKSSNEFKPFFVKLLEDNLIIANSNSFGMSKKGGFYERITMDLTGKIVKNEKYEGEKYDSNLNTRADLMDIETLKPYKGKFYNISVSENPAFGTTPKSTLGLYIAEINSDLAVEYNGFSVSHDPKPQRGNFTVHKIGEKKFVIYSQPEIGNFIVDLDNYKKPFLVKSSKENFYCYGSNMNYAVDEKNGKVYFAYPSKEGEFEIVKVGLDLK